MSVLVLGEENTLVCSSTRKLITVTSREAHRRQMAEAFAAAHGVEVADIIMEHLPPEGWSELATKKDLSEQALVFRHDLLVVRDELRSEITALRDELRSEMTGLRDELKSEITGIRIDMANGFTRQLKWIVGTMIGLFGAMSAVVSTVVLIAQ